MRTRIVAGNWKMHGSQRQLEALLGGVLDGLPTGSEAEVLVCPAYIYLQAAAAMIGAAGVRLGAQDVCEQGGEGAYTGEVSASMLQDVGCTHVIIGHSERRAMFGDSDQKVAEKFVTAQAAGLIPVLCVGETLEEREANSTEQVVGRQLSAVVEHAGIEALADAVLAYEPVWAIGTGRTASPEQAQQVHAYIREQLAQRNAKIAGSLRILYGGSVKPGNAAEIFAMPDVDGGLIGGASLQVEDFLQIVAAAG